MFVVITQRTLHSHSHTRSHTHALTLTHTLTYRTHTHALTHRTPTRALSCIQPLTPPLTHPSAPTPTPTRGTHTHTHASKGDRTIGVSTCGDDEGREEGVCVCVSLSMCVCVSVCVSASVWGVPVVCLYAHMGVCVRVLGYTTNRSVTNVSPCVACMTV